MSTDSNPTYYQPNWNVGNVNQTIVGGDQYDIKFYVFSPLAENGKIDWAQYGRESEAKALEPYKFLSYYDTTDADLFFGREAVSQKLVGKITNHKLVLINGKSGSGKTSLINAGIIPLLVARGYFTMVFRDYGYPTETIKKGLGSLPNSKIDLADRNTFLDCLRVTIQETQRPVAIFLDQFERFFLNLALDRRSQFAREFKDCLNNGHLNAQNMNVVISIREDFYGKLGEFWQDIPEFNTESYQHYLEPLNKTEATEAIKKPLAKIQQWKLGYDRDFLANCLVPSLWQRHESESNEQIEPVHLQIVCNRLFEEVRDCDRDRLEAGDVVEIDREIYDELGGVEGILQGYVEAILNRHYSREQQDEVKSVLKQMVTTQGTREFKSVAQIAENISLKAERVAEIIQQLDSSRLIETIPAAIDGDRKYSITHEYLAEKINQWYTLNELDIKRARELYERCLLNWKLNKQNRIPRSQLEYLRKYKPTLVKWKPEGKQLFRESEWLYHGFNVSVVVVAVTLVVVTIAALVGQRNAFINQIKLSRQSSETYFSSKQELEALIEALRSAKTLNHPVFKIFPPTTQLQNQVQGSLQRVVYGIRELNRFKGHQGDVNSVNFNSDGTRLATAGDDGYVILWNLAGEKLARFQADSTSINYVRFSPNDRYLVTEANHLVRLWDLTGNPLGEEFYILNKSSYPGSNLSFSSDGEKIVALGTDGTAHLRDSQGKLLKQLKRENSKIIDVSFSPDGSKIATAAEDGTVQLWDDMGNLNVLFQTHKSQDNQAVHREYINTIAFSPNSQQIATGGGQFTTRIWDLQGNQRDELKGPPPTNAESGSIDRIIFSPYSKELVTWESRGRESMGFRVWNLEYKYNYDIPLRANKLMFHPDGGRSIVDGRWFPVADENKDFVNGETNLKDFTFSLNNQRLATVEFDTIRLWELSRRRIAQKFEENEDIIVSPDGNLWATVDEKTISLWNRSSQKIAELTGEIPGGYRRNLFSPNGELIATEDGQHIIFWNPAGDRLGEIEIAEIPRFEFLLTFSPDNKLVATETNHESDVILWEITGKKLGEIPLSDRLVREVTVIFSPNGDRVVTHSDGGVIKLWDKTGNFIAELEKNCDWCNLYESPDGQIFAVASNGEKEFTSLWNWKGEELARLEGYIKRFSQGQDSHSVITTSKKINNIENKITENIYVWDLSKLPVAPSITPRKEKEFGQIEKIQQSANKKILVIQERNGQIYIWNLLNDRVTQLNQNGNFISISPDSKLLVTRSGDRKTHIWDIQGNHLTAVKGTTSKIVFNKNNDKLITFNYLNYSKISHIWDLHGNLLAEFEDSGDPLIFNERDNLLITSQGVWQLENLQQLMERGCNWLHDYRKYLEEGDRTLCDNVPIPGEN